MKEAIILRIETKGIITGYAKGDGLSLTAFDDLQTILLRQSSGFQTDTLCIAGIPAIADDMVDPDLIRHHLGAGLGPPGGDGYIMLVFSELCNGFNR